MKIRHDITCIDHGFVEVFYVAERPYDVAMREMCLLTETQVGLVNNSAFCKIHYTVSDFLAG